MFYCSAFVNDDNQLFLINLCISAGQNRRKLDVFLCILCFSMNIKISNKSLNFNMKVFWHWKCHWHPILYVCSFIELSGIGELFVGEFSVYYGNVGRMFVVNLCIA